MTLTDSQRKTYHFIRRFVAEKGYSPKLPEIAHGIGIRSRGVVHRYLKALSDAGFIRILPRQHRGVRLVIENPLPETAHTAIPIAGKIAAGKPIESIPYQEVLDISAMFKGRNLYALKVVGHSMIEAGIFNGDWVVCEHRNQAENGEIVVALVDGYQATLKRLKKQSDGRIVLLSANPSMRAMVYMSDRVQIQGVVVGQLRSYYT